VIIDGRILDIVRSGFLDGPLLFAAFRFARTAEHRRSSDAMRRTRGRRGLDVLTKLQALSPLES